MKYRTFKVQITSDKVLKYKKRILDIEKVQKVDILNIDERTYIVELNKGIYQRTSYLRRRIPYCKSVESYQRRVYITTPDTDSSSSYSYTTSSSDSEDEDHQYVKRIAQIAEMKHIDHMRKQNNHDIKQEKLLEKRQQEHDEHIRISEMIGFCGVDCYYCSEEYKEFVKLEKHLSELRQIIYPSSTSDSSLEEFTEE